MVCPSLPEPCDEYLEVAREDSLSNENVLVMDEKFDHRTVVHILLIKILGDVLEHEMIQRPAPIPLSHDVERKP